MRGMMLRKLLIAAGLVLALFAPAAARDVAQDVNVDKDGLLLHGYDPVAYFRSGGPQKGRADVTATFHGGTLRFASEENRTAFLADPEHYLPAYGGFCAMGMAIERKVDGDPQVWRIVDGKLYLNVNRSVAEGWAGDLKQNISSANGNWTRVKDVPATELESR